MMRIDNLDTTERNASVHNESEERMTLLPQETQPFGGQELTPEQWAEIEALTADVEQLILEARARSTRQAYGYWWRRFQRWCSTPSVRYRSSKLPAVDPTLPLDPLTVLIFLLDLTEGPHENDDRFDDWTAPSAGTIDSVLAALKANAQDAGMPFAAPTEFDAAVKGLRRRLSRRPVRVRAMVKDQLWRVCDHLFDEADTAPNALRDRIVLGLYWQRMGYTEIARLGRNALRLGTGGSRIVRIRAGSADHMSLPAELALDVGEWLNVLPNSSGLMVPAMTRGGRFRNTPMAPGQVRQILERLARAAKIDWLPTNGVPSDEEYRTMREAAVLIPWGHQILAIRDRALLLIGWAAMLRRSEIVNLHISDIEIRSEGILVYIRNSKTDQLGRGVTLPIPRGSRVSTDVVGAVESWLGILESIGDADEDRPLFRAVDINGIIAIGNGAVERVTAGTRSRTDGGMTGQAVAEMIRRRVVDAGVADAEAAKAYAGHSLRRGAITSLAEEGFEAAIIQKLSRHKSLAILAGYVDEARALDPDRSPMAKAKLL